MVGLNRVRGQILAGLEELICHHVSAPDHPAFSGHLDVVYETRVSDQPERVVSVFTMGERGALSSDTHPIPVSIEPERLIAIFVAYASESG